MMVVLLLAGNFLPSTATFTQSYYNIGLPLAISSSLEMIKKDEREYLNSLKGSKSKTFVLKKGSNELKEVMGSRVRRRKNIEFVNPFDVMFTRENETPVGSINTMERKLLEKKRKKESFAFWNDATGDSSEYEGIAEVVTPTKSAKSNSVVSPEEESINDKFSFAQRIESIKTAVVGLLSGGLAVTPITFLHDYIFPGSTIPNGLAQWEFDTDTGSIAAALFAIVYRYCVREGEESNQMLPMGVVGAFVIVRTLSRVRVSYYCEAAPLDCGAPLGYFDWSMLQQAMFSGLESIFLFGAAAAAMEYSYRRGYITRFK
jgi:hypothetical protein